MNVDFTDKVVLVTGASAGIGESTALLFAKLGAKLSLVGRNEANLRAVAAECEKQKGVKPLAIVADLGTDEGVEKIAKETLNHFKRLDVLVNNAGISVRTCIQLADMATFDEVFNVNVRGVYHLTKLLVPELIEAGGNIVNVSISVFIYLRCLKQFNCHRTFQVSNIVKRITGYTEDQYQSWLSSVAPTIPMGEVCQGSDIAQMIVHLASDNSRLVTGTVVPVDGGMRFTSPGNLFTKQMK
ncbi:hypothetical protein HF086_008126 [Spodoptera exigua]|uniref:Alcohol dehydrogenase n=1 Tax=Spodoptera exigua TaxID=7107 RepID=A0A922MMY3_SPOEX|nr:hypothetical protein HF086_008126 [Spodoptera exigua]